MIGVGFILWDLFGEKLKEGYWWGVEVVGGFEDSDVVCMVRVEGFGGW